MTYRRPLAVYRAGTGRCRHGVEAPWGRLTFCGLHVERLRRVRWPRTTRTFRWVPVTCRRCLASMPALLIPHALTLLIPHALTLRSPRCRRR